MSDMQGTADFTGIPRSDKSSTSLEVSHSDDIKFQDLIDRYENHSKDVLKKQEDESNKHVSKMETEILLEQEKGTNKELLNNEMEIFVQQENHEFKTVNEAQKTKELAFPIEIKSDAQNVEPSNATSEKMEDYRSSEENNNLSLNETSATKTDSWRTDSFGSSTEEDNQVLEDIGSELIISVEKMESKKEQILASLEDIVSKKDEKVSQVTESPAEEPNLNSDNNDPNLSSVKNAGTSTEYSLEESTVSQSTQTSVSAGEQSSNSGNNSKVSEVVNAGTSTGDSLEECKVSQSTQVPEGTDEGNKSYQINSHEVKNLEKSIGDKSDEEISNYQESSPKEGRMDSERVTEIIYRRLNSEEYKKKLSEINDIVKRLTAVEFISPHLSTEDMEALAELYCHQGLLEEDIDWETHSEVSESNAMKRKSKEPSESGEDEDFQATSKKCKFSKELDSWLLSGANSCCIEEQFRLACEQSKEGNEEQSQKEKEYKFPITESGENQERKYKLCKHQIAKIDAMVVSAMSLESYLSQLNDVVDSNEMSTESALLDYLSNAPKSGSSRTRKFSNKNVARQQKSFNNEELTQSNEQLDGVEKNFKGYGYFGLGEAFNTIKNLILSVCLTGSLTIAIAVAKIFGVTFPVPKSQRNLPNDSKSSLQEFPDVNLDESRS